MYRFIIIIIVMTMFMILLFQLASVNKSRGTDKRNSEMSASMKEIKRDLIRALNSWIPRRKKTVKTLKKLKNNIHYNGKIANTFKLGGNAVSAVAGVVSGTLGIATIFTGGLAIPFVVCGTVAAGAGIIGTVAASGAEVTKSVMFPRLLKEAQNIINKEIDEYLTVIRTLKRLNIEITDKSRVDQSSDFQPLTAAGRYFSDTALNLLAAHSNALNHFTKVASCAAAKAAVTTARETAKVTVEALAKEATDAANKATNSNICHLVKKISENSIYTEVIMTAGKTAGEAALTTVGKGLSEEAAIAVVEIATVSATKSAAETALKESAKVTDIIPGAGGWLSWLRTTVGKTAGKAVSLLNFGFAIWNATESVKAGVDIARGSEEERELREKIEEFIDEGNKIVDIYNHYFGNNDPMVVPFPDVSL